ncbi:hypothetical protein D9M71_613310 [compost metagenome]
MPEQMKPAAIVRSRYGDPEAFGERWLEVVADVQSMPYDTKLYAIPADQVLVPRELLERVAEALEEEVESRYAGTKDHPAIKPKYERDIAEADQLRTLLQQ